MGLNDGPDFDITRPMWEEIRRDHSPFSGVFAWAQKNIAVGEGKDFQEVPGILVSGDFFRVLGVEPWRGRLLVSEDEHSCPESTAVVSYAFWQSKLGGREIGS